MTITKSNTDIVDCLDFTFTKRDYENKLRYILQLITKNTIHSCCPNVFS